MASKDDCIRAAMRAGATQAEARDLVSKLFAEKAAMKAAGHAYLVVKASYLAAALTFVFLNS